MWLATFNFFFFFFSALYLICTIVIIASCRSPGSPRLGYSYAKVLLTSTSCEVIASLRRLVPQSALRLARVSSPGRGAHCLAWGPPRFRNPEIRGDEIAVQGLSVWALSLEVEARVRRYLLHTRSLAGHMMLRNVFPSLPRASFACVQYQVMLRS